MPRKPNQGESKEDYVSYCIPKFLQEGMAQDQAAAACYSLWDKSLGKSYESKAKFVGSFRAANDEEFEKIGISKASMISEATSLMPKSFDVKSNSDVLPIFFNLALVNKFNANGDGLSASDAAKVVKNFIHKPINIEHKKDLIVGHIINASLSKEKFDFQDNDLVDFVNEKDPFYITAAGLIYKSVYPDLAYMLEEASNPESEYYESYATSWEISFDDYKIAVGSNDLKYCSIYSEDNSSFELYDRFLKSEGGSGVYQGQPVNRLISGKKIPLGCALTENPAAEVEGVYTLNNLIKSDSKLEKTGKYNKTNINGSKKNSNLIKNNVTDNNDTFDMTDEQFKEFMDTVKSLASDKTQESQASTAMEKISTVLKEAGTEWKSKAEQAQEEADRIKSELEDVKQNFSKANDELKSLKEDLAVKEAADRLNTRMNSIASNFELTEEEEAIVGEEVRALGDADEDFDKYLAKAKVIFSHRTKEAIAAKKEEQEKEKEEDSKESQASKKDETKNKEEQDGDLEFEDESQANISNNNAETSENKSLVDRIKEAGLELDK